MADEPDTETPDYDAADSRITVLLDDLRSRGVCPCCSARALTVRGLVLAQAAMGSAMACELAAQLIEQMRADNVPPPARGQLH